MLEILLYNWMVLDMDHVKLQYSEILTPTMVARVLPQIPTTMDVN